MEGEQSEPLDPLDQLRSAFAAAGARFAVGGSWASATHGEARFTNDVDILADLSQVSLEKFLDTVPTDEFYFDREQARESFARGRAFNLIHMPTALKFDLFPARAFPLGLQELDRAVLVPVRALSKDPVPFVTSEDILLAKLHWFREGGEVSERQWRDILGVLKTAGAKLDQEYLRRGASQLGVSLLLDRALGITKSL